MTQTDVIIIGAGASGLMCAITAGKRGKRVMVLDHAKQPGSKILMSGGGRCNFTNLNISSENYISHNPHFCKSAIKRYTQWDFIELVHLHNIKFEERAHGQLFCLNSSRDIIEMLLKECQNTNITIEMSCKIERIEKLKSTNNIEQAEATDQEIQNKDHLFKVFAQNKIYQCRSLVIATGGLSIPSCGATPFGYRVAEQFGINIWSPRAGLVPFTLNPDDKKILSPLSGIALDAIVETGEQRFRENILFTHRGLSGPVILQISSYWTPGETVRLNLLPEVDLFEHLTKEYQQVQKRKSPETQQHHHRHQLRQQTQEHPSTGKKLKFILSAMLPKRLIAALIPEKYCEMRLAEISHRELRLISDKLQQWIIKPAGTEGYRTAEVTVGGVDCDFISSKTMEARDVKGLFFTGEVLDVTGWLGGYNLQWAWSSGWCAGQAV
ncbi:MAG: NAD(P)/FAD-dependent oxidoreductase [Desulfamplus sp.]|nr:NAD(P)/FAD-dependent oxidoreductase [Desulfamplus sp.]